MALPRLTGSPEARSMSVQRLLESVAEGRVRIPRFQRPLRWRHPDNARLLDSIVRGYPIGTLLFWKRAGTREHIVLGPYEHDVEERADVMWVVDGQQRIVALVTALMLEAHVAPRDRLAFDLEHERVVRMGDATTSETKIPLQVAFDATELGVWATDRGLDRETTRAAHDLGRRIREYEVAAYVVETEDERILQAIFDRTNTSGKRLTAEDVFAGLHGTPAAQSAPTSFTALSDRIGEIGMGRIPSKWLYRSALAIKGIDATRQLPEAFREPGALAGTLSDATPALAKALEFLQDEVDISHLSLLPYGLPLAVLAKFFSKFPGASERSRELLARWLWRGALTGRHRAESIPYARANLDAIKGTESATLQQLLALVPSSKPANLTSKRMLGPFRVTSAETRIQLNALASLGPCDLITGEPIDILGLLEGGGPHKLARILSPSQVGLQDDHRLLARTSANRLLVPSSLYEATVPVLTSVSEKVAASHAFDVESMRSLKSGDAGAAVSRRASTILSLVDTFGDAHARWSDVDRPSIDALADDAEDVDA